MDEQRQDDQLEPTYSSSVPIPDVALKTCWRRWMIGRGGEKGSGISVLMAWHDDDDDDDESSLPIPWTREEKIFCVTTYLEAKSFKTVLAKFCWMFHFTNYPQKSQIYRWLHKFQAAGSVNNLKRKAENPRSGRKLTATWQKISVICKKVNHYCLLFDGEYQKV